MPPVYWTAASSPTITATDPLWGAWINGTATSTTGTVADWTWVQWLNTITTTSSAATWAPLRPDPEAVAREQERARAAAKEKQRAARRAERLLFLSLTPAQRRQRREDDYFDVPMTDERQYRIHRGVVGNVREMVLGPDGAWRAIAKLCCHPQGLPEADTHLAQLLWLRADEARFREIANITRYPSG
jgi:hypothetical protein